MPIYLEHVVETGKRFNEHVDSFVGKLVATGRKHVQRLVQIKVVVAVEMASNEVVDLFL